MGIDRIESRMIPTDSGRKIQKKSKAETPQSQDSVDVGSGKTKKIEIIHVNDIHGTVEPFFDPATSKDSDVGGLANMATVIKEEEAKNPDGTLVLNAGDMADGSMISDATHGRAVAHGLNQLKFDAVGLGNHEFCWGTEPLKNMLDLIDSPAVAANVVQGENNKPVPWVKPYIIKEVNGVKVGIIGLDTPKTQKQTKPEHLNGARFRDVGDTLAEYLPKMKDDGAQVTVVLSHNKLNDDVKLAKRFKDEQLVIVGGHSHAALKDGLKAGGSIIAQAGSMTRYVGKVSLEYDPDSKKIVNTKAKLIPVIDSKIKPDEEVKDILQPYIDQVDKMGGGEVVSHAAEDLRYSHYDALKLNQLQADSLLHGTDADCAVSIATSVRRDIKKGPVNVKNLYNTLPFVNWKAVEMKVKGKNLKRILEDGVEDSSRMMIPAGMTYEYDRSLPEGHRVLNAKMSDCKPLDPEKEYKIITNDYIANKDYLEDVPNSEIKECGPVQEKFFEYFESKCPEGGWRNNPDNRVRNVGPKV